MKKIAFLTAICFCLIVTMLSINVTAESIASGQCGDNLTWILDDKGTLTIRGYGEMYDWKYKTYAPWESYSNEIKEVIIENGITYIGSYAFYNVRSPQIIIPSSVVSIGNYAFSRAYSSNIIIPDSVTNIGSHAFESSSIGMIKIPDSVNTINRAAFQHCSNLKTIDFGKGVSKIDTYAFRYCDALTKIIIPDTVLDIEQEAFGCCRNLQEVVIGKGVRRLGWWAFIDCPKLEKVFITKNLYNLSYGVFSDCPSLEIYYEGNKTEWKNISLEYPQPYTHNGYLTTVPIHYNHSFNALEFTGNNTIDINSESSLSVLLYGDLVYENITYSLSNAKIIEINNLDNGIKIKGLKGGKATITATHSSGATASIEITVNDFTVELEKEYSEFLDEEKETIYSYKVKNGDSIALASETEVVLEIVNKDGTEIARIKNYNDYSGTFEIEGLAIGECELVAKINGVEMDRAPINILGNIADTINNETVLRAKVLLNNNRYKYYRDNDSIHHVHIDGIGLGASVFYQNAGNSLNLLFESITEGKSTNDINASQAYKVVLLKLLYGGNKLDEYMDYANKIDTYFLKYGSMIENKTPILGVNNVKDLKTQFSNLLKGSTIDLGILDSVLVVGKSMRECISEMERIYMLASCSDSQVKALQLIAANTSDKNLKQACNELATEIIIATDTKLIQAAGTGFVAGWNTLVEETACSVVQGALNFIPGVTVWNISLDATKLGLNSLFKIDDSAEDLINLSALHSIENSLYNAMLNAEKKFSSNMTADNALNFMATADFYKEILLYGNDVIRNMVVHNAEAKVNLNATKLVLKSLFDSEKDLVDTVNSYFEKEGITHQLECIDQLKTLLENADFYSTDGIDIAAYIREVKSTTPSEWAKPEIQKAIDMCILPDYMQNNYQNNITRAEFCTLLTYFIEAKGENVDSLIKEKGALIKTPFSDTYYEYVDYMYKLGIVNGVGDGIFQPLGEITREQAATMLMRAAKVLDVDTTAKNSGFTGISDWAADGVNYVVYNGIMNGTGNGFEPQGKFTKEQAIATLVRMLGKI